MKLRQILNEAFSKDVSNDFKKGWIGSFVIREKDKKKFKVVDAKHYGNQQELELENGIILSSHRKPWFTDENDNKYDPA